MIKTKRNPKASKANRRLYDGRYDRPFKIF
jgi:hypothetical protein